MTDEDVKKVETLKAELQKVIDYFHECEEEAGNTSDGVRTMKIQDLLKQAKPCWKYAAMDLNKKWRCYTDKPKLEWCYSAELEGFDPHEWVMVDGYKMPCLSDFFDIEPFDGDWKDSLISREEC